MYRLLQFATRVVLERSLGPEEAARILYRGRLRDRAGTGAGRYRPCSGSRFVCAAASGSALELGVGAIRFEKTDLDAGEIVLTVSEDLDCSGVEEYGEAICTYDEGLIAALLGEFTG